MSNPFYSATGIPLPHSQGRSAPVSQEYGLIRTGFDLVNNVLATKLDATSPVGYGDGDFSGMASFKVPVIPSTGDNSLKAANTAFVQAVLGAGGTLLPPQDGNAGAVLATNGTSASWSLTAATPDQSGQAGKYLYTNGSVTSWQPAPAPSWDSVTSKPAIQHPLSILANGVMKTMGPLGFNFASSNVTVSQDVVTITPVSHFAFFTQGVL